MSNTDEEYLKRIKSLMTAAERRLEEASEKYPDVKELLKTYHELKTQTAWSDDFTKGYMSCISDLIIVKKML